MPPIPDVARHFIRLHGKADIGERDIESLIDRFPVFFEQLLAVINSDHFNLTTKVKSIGQAIELAGFERVCNIMLCLVVYKTFSGIKIHGVDADEFWQDVLRRAASARMIGELAGLDGSRCFTAGLLQDMGFYLLFLISPNKGPLWPDFRKREPEARYSMERNIFNMNHDQAMEIFCNHWQLREVVATPVIHHHRCDRSELSADDEKLCKVLYCADWMTSVYTAMDKNFVISRCRQLLTECFSMEAFRTEELLAALPDEVATSAAALNIHIKEHIEFSQILYQANIKLSEDNLNFQELTHRLEQALDAIDWRRNLTGSWAWRVKYSRVCYRPTRARVFRSPVSTFRRAICPAIFTIISSCPTGASISTLATSPARASTPPC